MLRTEAGVRAGRPRAVLRAWWPLAGAVLLAFLALSYTRADPDLWGHVRFGLDTLRTWLTTTDPYSFTQDRPWLNHEWLSEVQMAVVWRAGGTAGVALAKALLAGTVFWLSWSATRGAAVWVRLLVIAVMAFGTVHMTATFRPQLWTFVAFAVVCRSLSTDQPRRRWIPVIFALWANLHGGWVVGLGVLGAWAMGTVLSTRRGLGRWATLCGLSAAATLATPYGWRLWTFAVETVRPEREILEWEPLWTQHLFSWVPWVAAAAAGVWLLRRARPDRLATVLVLAVLAYGSVRVMRLESLFVVASVILLAPALVDRRPAGLVELPRRRPRGEAVVAATLFLVLAALSMRVGSVTLSCIPLSTTWMPDTEAAQWLTSARPGRLVTFFDWGEYAIWQFGPSLRVSMDGRRETVYSNAVLSEHDAILNGTAEGLATLDAWRAEYVWLPAWSETTRGWLAAHGYRVEVQTDRSFVAVRDDLPPLRGPGEGGVTASNPGRCFPA